MPFGIIGRRVQGSGRYWGLAIGPREALLLGANLGCAIVTNGDFTAYVCNSAATWPSSQITLGKLVSFINTEIIIHFNIDTNGNSVNFYYCYYCCVSFQSLIGLSTFSRVSGTVHCIMN